MARADRTGNRKPRDSFKKRAPDLGNVTKLRKAGSRRTAGPSFL